MSVPPPAERAAMEAPVPVVSSVFTSGHMMAPMHMKVSIVCMGFYVLFCDCVGETRLPRKQVGMLS